MDSFPQLATEYLYGEWERRSAPQRRPMEVPRQANLACQAATGQGDETAEQSKRFSTRSHLLLSYAWPRHVLLGSCQAENSTFFVKANPRVLNVFVNENLTKRVVQALGLNL